MINYFQTLLSSARAPCIPPPRSTTPSTCADPVGGFKAETLGSGTAHKSESQLRAQHAASAHHRRPKVRSPATRQPSSSLQLGRAVHPALRAARLSRRARSSTLRGASWWDNNAFFHRQRLRGGGGFVKYTLVSNRDRAMISRRDFSLNAHTGVPTF